ncbi:nitroreductase family protein [Psychromonas sp. Urea-02u-13]|uniref:nitroreductase family protein n=1 Tax=Psychromonas sp. Urea-02u-13 TaxID=2058326 RepID=UPI000C31F9A2|nr:nitroreductase family protein [Psychromonas sp. Urea-02u-13]PKG38444.1 nitroreductase family protein [Psychromonas sp. Urea-02u-13]
MDFFTTLQLRRAVKHYDNKATMPAQDFEKLMDSVLLSPTSYNIQNWRFVRISDKHKRLRLKQAAWGQQQVEDASEVLILCADSQAWSDRPERYWANTESSVQEMILPMIESFYTGKKQTQRDETMRSCGMAAQTLMLSAKALGYDSCPMIEFDNEQVANIINLPEHHVICMMIVIGKALKPANPRAGQLPVNEVLFENSF